MGKFGGLIEGQDISFDTHQSGDQQVVRLKDLHLEKRLHTGGKIRFPFFGIGDPTYSSRVTQKTYSRIRREVKRTLNKNSDLKNGLAEVMVEQIKRFSSGEATVSDAQEAARNIARYFNLNEDFVDSVARFAGETLVQVVTHHKKNTSSDLVEINQSKDAILLRDAPSVYTARLRRKRSTP